MVVARHIGRLGNNMFQIAAAIGYARKYGYQWGVDSNSGVGEPYSSIHKCFPDLPKVNYGGGQRYHEHNNEFCELHRAHKDYCHFDYHPIPDMGANVSLTGFYQSWKYFERQDDEIKKVFALPHVSGYEDYVSIHVRRGDYVQHAGSFPPVTTWYLYEAIKTYLNILLDIKGCYATQKIMIFSDDIKWCKENKDNIWPHGDAILEFSEGRTELQDLSLMASCGHHIIANSTFSWWGAYLGHNPNRIVVSPSAETWFGVENGVKRPVVDLIPENWVQINTR